MVLLVLAQGLSIGLFKYHETYKNICSSTLSQLSVMLLKWTAHFSDLPGRPGHLDAGPLDFYRAWAN
jgi:hypothetical protein